MSKEDVKPHRVQTLIFFSGLWVRVKLPECVCIMYCMTFNRTGEKHN